MTDKTLNIEYRNTADLVPYVNNAKVHEPAQVDQLAASIKEFGFNNPILLDGSSGVIAGHGRLLAANKLKLETVPTIELGHLTDNQKKAYILADNRLGEVNTSWNFDLVSQELESLNLEDFDIELTGFDSDFLLDTLGDGTGEGTGDDESDRGELLGLIDVTIGEPKNQLDAKTVYKLDNHYLITCSPVNEWALFVGFLQDENDLLCPYPGPYVAITEKAQTHRLIMVQPDLYIAGHVVDSYLQANPGSKLEAAQ